LFKYLSSLCGSGLMIGSIKHRLWIFPFIIFMLAGCISPDNATVEGSGTPDVTGCSSIDGVADGADFTPQTAVVHGSDGRTHPDLFYIAWAQLDERTDLRFPARGYDDAGYEDKLLVSRRVADGSYKSWQIWPPIGSNCQDTEKVRIHSFDVAPDGKSLFVSMSRSEVNNPNRKLGIYRLDIASQTIQKISKDNTVDFLNPTYIGNDAIAGHEMLLVAKSVKGNEIPINYGISFLNNLLLDEYDRAPTPLIHKMDAQTGDTIRIGFNNSHQTEPVATTDPDGRKIIVFNQWEHQENTNRFALWKMQIDGSDGFTFFGQEASTDRSGADLYSPRIVRSGPYQGYALMGQAARSNHNFTAEGHILMTKRAHFDLRSDKIFLQTVDSSTNVDQRISRTPEHYNDQSFSYAYRDTVDNTYSIYVKDYPASLAAPLDTTPGIRLISNNNYHFMQPRSFYPPASQAVAPGEGDIGENRVSFTNMHLAGRSGFLVQNLTESDNGVQHQLDGISHNDLSLQFYIPSHHFVNSNAVGLKTGQETSIPASDFISPESDGSLGVVMKEGLYVWKVHKRFSHTDAQGANKDLWIPVRAERQEISFVPNRVNACNQCHQERDQANLDRYASYDSIAAQKMQGNLSDMLSSSRDISNYDATDDIPDFHKDIIPLLEKPGRNGGQSCMDCHNAQDKLNLSNKTGTSAINTTFRNLLWGAHKRSDNNGVVPYLSDSINPLGMDDKYSPAPFLWSILLNDDLTEPPASGYPNDASRSLRRAGDYGAKYDAVIASDIAAVTAQYDHSKHWSTEDLQKFITYTVTQIPVGLSDRIPQSFTANSLSRTTPAAQKAYQAMVRQCFSCHTSNLDNGVNIADFGLPLLKRYVENFRLRDPNARFVVNSHVQNKPDTKYAAETTISDLPKDMDSTLQSASQRIDFNNRDNSELLVYARGGKNADGVTGIFKNTVSPSHPALDITSADYLAIANWVKGISATNQSPTMSQVGALTIEEYDDTYVRNPNTGLDISWSDPDGDPPFGINPPTSGELSQAFINGSGTTTHSFNDTMLGLDYQSFNSAKLKTYAILGDRGTQNFEFSVSDGLSGAVQQVPVTVNSTYNVPVPRSDMPDMYAFYTVRATGELRKLTNSGDELVGTIPNYNGSTWTTVYRRADKKWLYFVEQTAQRIHVVDETNANYLFRIDLNHLPNRDSSNHKQTVYLIWWRPAEGNPGDVHYRPGQLQAILESKLSEYRNGDYHVDLGDGEAPTDASAIKTVTPIYREKILDGGDTVGVYVWRRATFMTKWNSSALDNNGLDRVNVLNLVTGKAKPLTNYRFTEQQVNGITYPARDYHNVRALVVADDGAFYGFNKDLNSNVEVFNFDPLNKTQMPVNNIPAWIGSLMNNPITYATPFVVIPERTN
jgi:cytochrome c553